MDNEPGKCLEKEDWDIHTLDPFCSMDLAHTHTHNDLWDIQNDLRSSGVHQRGKWTFLFRHCIAKPIMQNGAKSRIEFFCFISAMMFSKTPPDQQLHKTGT